MKLNVVSPGSGMLHDELYALLDGIAYFVAAAPNDPLLVGWGHFVARLYVLGSLQIRRRDLHESWPAPESHPFSAR